jgi:hypothetical protein
MNDFSESTEIAPIQREPVENNRISFRFGKIVRHRHVHERTASRVMSNVPNLEIFIHVRFHFKRGSIACYMFAFMASLLMLLVMMLFQ